jgi:hypothetical protein
MVIKMKKKLMLVLAMALLYGSLTGATGAAEPNLLDDVPANHWTYSDLNQLIKAGIVDEYKGQFNGGKTLTRYEMAQIVAKAMARADNSDAETNSILDRLAQEFHDEIYNNFLIRINELEAKEDKVKMAGSYIRVRWDKQRTSQNGTNIKDLHPTSYIRAHLGFQGEVNDDWKWVVHFRQQANWYDSGSAGSQTGFINRAYVQGKVGETDVTLGKIYYPSLDLGLWDSYYNGVQIGFGNKLKTKMLYGYQHGNAQAIYYDKDNPGLGNYVHSQPVDTGLAKSKTLLTGIDFRYDDKPMVYRGIYYSLEGVHLPNTFGTNTQNVGKVMVTRQLNPDWEFETTYTKSDAKLDNRDYSLKLAYKKIDISKPGTYSVQLQYRNAQRFAQWNGGGYATDVVLNPKDDKFLHNSRIWDFEVFYTPWKNTFWRTELSFAKSTDGSNIKDTVVGSYIQYLF